MKVGLGRHLCHRLGYSFGRVHTATTCIAVATILDRRLAGESEETIMADYNMPRAEIDAAIEWVYRLVAAEEQRLRDKARRAVERESGRAR